MTKNFLALQEEPGGIPIDENAKGLDAPELQLRNLDNTGTGNKRSFLYRLGMIGQWVTDIISGRCPNINLH